MSLDKPHSDAWFKEEFKKGMNRYPTPLEHIFGTTMHYLEREKWLAWKNFVDAIIPDWWPMGTLQGYLFSILNSVYLHMDFKAYFNGARTASKIEQGITGVFNKAKDRIESEITKLKNKVETELFNPLKNKINNELIPTLNDAESKLRTLGVDVSKALGDVDVMQGNIAGFGSKIKGFDSKLLSFDSKLKDFNSSLSSLDSRIRNSETSLNSLNRKINDLIAKVGDADNTLSNHKDWIDNLKGRVSSLEGREPTEEEKEEEEEKPFFDFKKFLEGL